MYLQDDFRRELATARRGPISDAVLPLNGALLDRQQRIDVLNGERQVLARWMAEALLVLGTLDTEDSEDGGESLRMLRERGYRLVKAVLPTLGPNAELNGRPT
jgi:hypothetical protein